MPRRLVRAIATIFEKDNTAAGRSAGRNRKGSAADMDDSDQDTKTKVVKGQSAEAPESAAQQTTSDTLQNEKKGAAPAEPRIDVASRCHVGRVRPRNEDSCISFVSQSGGTEPLPLFGLFIVADGMGGHNDGHRASKLVARTVAKHVLESLYYSLLQEGHNGAPQPVQETMEQAVALANEALSATGAVKEMGTTLTAAVILGNRLFLVHVGDSRAYLMSEGELSLITTDHTFVQALQDAGQLTAEEAAIHPNRNLLYRSLMGDVMQEPVDVFTRSLPQQGTLVLCSDGLWGSVGEQTIAEILDEDIDLQDKAQRLLDEALEAGGEDNITVILAAFDY
ncbi:MAG: PP2C family protein-serine/threonine phosphatase [Chloroflexota bacterium]